jgi:hypothetical protein
MSPLIHFASSYDFLRWPNLGHAYLTFIVMI